MLDKLIKLKLKLETLRPFPPAALENLERWFEVELTYTSNAIEGNTLTRAETALVLEKGLTVGGKPMKDHLEAINHRNALQKMKALTRQDRLILDDILALHECVLKGVDDTHAGGIRSVSVRVSGSMVVFPTPLKVPYLLDEFVAWLNSEQTMNPVQKAALAHYKLVSIHPFIDGNGRTARLLMNLILIKHGYPPSLTGPFQDY
jgi:Fic family protein